MLAKAYEAHVFMLQVSGASGVSLGFWGLEWQRPHLSSSLFGDTMVPYIE